MQAPRNLELVSFNLCPYVQRSIITLLEKEMDFKITYIDLANPPAWFLQISPFGKVPVLKVDNAVIFESAVINEYIDETSPPALHPSDPLKRAINRAWIEFGSSLLVNQYEMMTAKNKNGFEDKYSELIQKLSLTEAQLSSGGPFFNGSDFSLVDAAIAPLFMRLTLLEQHIPGLAFIASGRIEEWRAALLSRSSVQQSVIPDFEKVLMDYLQRSDSYIRSLLQ